MELLQKYLPAAETLIGQLGASQRTWLNTNVDSLAPFIQSDKGREALLLFLSEFADFTIASKVQK